LKKEVEDDLIVHCGEPEDRSRRVRINAIPSVYHLPPDISEFPLRGILKMAGEKSEVKFVRFQFPTEFPNIFTTFAPVHECEQQPEHWAWQPGAMKNVKPWIFQG